LAFASKCNLFKNPPPLGSGQGGRVMTTPESPLPSLTCMSQQEVPPSSLSGFSFFHSACFYLPSISSRVERRRLLPLLSSLQRRHASPQPPQGYQLFLRVRRRPGSPIRGYDLFSPFSIRFYVPNNYKDYFAPLKRNSPLLGRSSPLSLSGR